jgi:hypothetical protein
MFNPFLLPVMLFGLGAIAIPPIIHLLNRRRFEVVDWGAMQFLKISETTRRRLLIEEVLLMMLRMGLIAIMVLAMAAPFIPSALLPGIGPKPNRDVVLIFDGSYSMGYTGTGPSAHDEAKKWALDFVNDLSPGDTVAVLQAKQQVVPVIGEPTHDLEKVRASLDKLPTPAGGCDWPAAVEEAHRILKKSQRPHRDMILLTDGQRHGWADDHALLGWNTAARNMARDRADVAPRITVINLDPDRPKEPPNWALVKFDSSRAVAAKDREVRFKADMQLRGQKDYSPPWKLRFEVDGQPERDLPAPPTARLDKDGNVLIPLTFTHKFSTVGSHLVSLIVEPDPPLKQRPASYFIKDHLPGDNRLDLALEVLPALPVLIVDGEERSASDSRRDRGTDFMRKALTPDNKAPAVLAEVVPLVRFDATALQRDLSKEPGSKPRVLVLFNVPRLTVAQQDAVTKFLAAGGGVLVTLGDRVEARHYNEELYRAGEGWLPAQVNDMDGDPTEPNRAATPLLATFFHPALDIFREVKATTLAGARMPRWWKVTPPGRGSSAQAVAQLNTRDPLLVEKNYQLGRVMLCTVPLDDSWRTNLVGLPDYVVLLHELMYYLAGTSSTRQNLKPGQRIRYQPSGDETLRPVALTPPQGEVKQLPVLQWPLDYTDTRETGVYQLESGGKKSYYVVQPDMKESNLTPNSATDREKVTKLVPMTYADRSMNLALAALDDKQELWMWFLVGVIVLLCGEVWMTRRIALNR